MHAFICLFNLGFNIIIMYLSFLFFILFFTCASTWIHPAVCTSACFPSLVIHGEYLHENIEVYIWRRLVLDRLFDFCFLTRALTWGMIGWETTAGLWLVTMWAGGCGGKAGLWALADRSFWIRPSSELELSSSVRKTACRHKYTGWAIGEQFKTLWDYELLFTYVCLH